ncbi:MAG: M18 family aminopeptidase [Clostridia bacterium]|nr:M18 family aminopeptidase [Clostridia bacterium]
MKKNSIPEDAKKLLKFIDASPTPYHGTEILSKMLEEAGAIKLSENDIWDRPEPGKTYYLTRNGSCIAAFRLGKTAPEKAGWHISLAHLDYPCLKVRPNPSGIANTYERVNAETYGGLIQHSWFDRPLGLAGRVYVRSDDTEGFTGVNINIDRPLLVIPELAIHMNHGVNDNAHFNPQTEMLPVFSQSFENKAEFTEFIAAAVNKAPKDILSYDLTVYDCQKACTLGEHDEFISAPHLDDGEMVFCAFTGFIDAAKKAGQAGNSLPEYNSLVIAFDHEEVGSVSDRGARSNLLGTVLKRIQHAAGDGEEALERALINSVICSADMAHASHPSYPATFDPDHKVFINKGPVLKHSFSQTYIESPKAAAIFRKFCGDNRIPFQEFVNRNDLRGGSTVGPASAASIGSVGFDIGNAIFSMHSIREFGGTADVKYAADFFRAFHK